MNNISRHRGTLTIVKRLRSSTNGNPRFLLNVAGISCLTPVDSSLGYAVKSLDGKHVEATIGTHYGKPTLNTVKALKAI